MAYRDPPSRGVEKFEGATSALSLWQLAPHVLMVRHEGDGEEAIVEPFGVAVRRELARQRCHVFHDTSALRNYHTGYRVQMTVLFRQERPRLLSLQALVKSKIVAMGAAVANLALGGIVRVYSGEREFDDAVARALAEERRLASR